MKRSAALASPLLLLLAAAPAAADGFHSPLLRNPDPSKWAQTERERLGLDRSDSADDSGGSTSGFDRRRAAKQLVDVLKYLEKKNVLLREFPDFNYDNIPGFKSETEALLIAIGRDAVPLLLEVLITDLSGQDQPEAQFAGLSRASDLVKRLERILIAIGEDSLEFVIPRLDHPKTSVRISLLRIVREIVVDPDFGKDISAWKGWYAIFRAGKDRAAAAVPQILARLEDQDRRLRLAAARALGEIGDRRAVGPLVAALVHAKDDPMIRAVARALAKIGDFRAVPALIDLLTHVRSSVRQEAVTALRFLTREMMGFDPRGSRESRAAAVARWREWWEKR